MRGTPGGAQSPATGSLPPPQPTTSPAIWGPQGIVGNSRKPHRPSSEMAALLVPRGTPPPPSSLNLELTGLPGGAFHALSPLWSRTVLESMSVRYDTQDTSSLTLKVLPMMEVPCDPAVGTDGQAAVTRILTWLCGLRSLHDKAALLRC